ncbi:MAG: hypothetical protein C4547_16020 [Phycisphaerales bacterium]|nr:MAG: hypothetical protein C4547_16020 [Phycisphaerales bacterium]
MTPRTLLLVVTLCGALTLEATAQSQVWVKRYKGPGSSYDQAVDLAVDQAGNVYVTGFTGDGSPSHDIVTIKYSAGGDELWLARYDGPQPMDDDRPVAIGLDDAGNVYVAATTRAGENTADWVTIKYDSGGTRQWAAIYDGPAHRNDSARALAVDSDGDAYVTGAEIQGDHSSRCLTIKYDPSGNQAWVRRFSEGVSSHGIDIALDRAGDVVVLSTGQGGQSSAYVTIKYAADGQQSWVQRYDTPEGDEPVALVVDHVDDVVVTGYSKFGFATVKYTSEGLQQWVREYGSFQGTTPAALAADYNDNIVVTGYTNVGDWVTIKYKRNGNQLWVATFNGEVDRQDRPSALATDDAGNTYVTGRTSTLRSAEDILTIKYDPEGNEVWTVSYNGRGNDYDDAVAVATHPSGYVYVTGHSEGRVSNFDFATIKYTQSAECRGNTRLNVNCFLRCRDGRQHVQAKVTADLPEGTELTLLLDDGDPQVVSLRRRGKAKANWIDVASGIHVVKIVECDLSEEANCCG